MDAGLAIGTGCQPLFAPEPQSFPQISRRRFAAKYPELNTIYPLPDSILSSAWADLRDFSDAANIATTTGAKIPPSLFTSLSTSVPHRLMSLDYEKTSIHELLRLSMLAYVKSVIIRMKGIGRNLTFLAEKLKSALLFHLTSLDPEKPPLLFWACFMAALAVFEGNEPGWLRVGLQQTMLPLGMYTWPQARDVLKRYLWTDMLHDAEGEKMFHEDLMNPLVEPQLLKAG